MKVGNLLDEIAKGDVKIKEGDDGIEILFKPEEPTPLANLVIDRHREAFNRLRAAGLAVQCSACVHMQSRTEVSTDVECGQKCTGPMAGGDFPMFRGPIARDDFPDFCFICGRSSVVAVHRQTWQTPFGLCDRHQHHAPGQRVQVLSIQRRRP